MLFPPDTGAARHPYPSPFPVISPFLLEHSQDSGLAGARNGASKKDLLTWSVLDSVFPHRSRAADGKIFRYASSLISTSCQSSRSLSVSIVLVFPFLAFWAAVIERVRQEMVKCTVCYGAMRANLTGQ